MTLEDEGLMERPRTDPVSNSSLEGKTMSVPSINESRPRDSSMETKKPHTLYMEKGKKVIYTTQGNRIELESTNENMLYAELTYFTLHPEVEEQIYGNKYKVSDKTSEKGSKKQSKKIKKKSSFDDNILEIMARAIPEKFYGTLEERARKGGRVLKSCTIGFCICRHNSIKTIDELAQAFVKTRIASSPSEGKELVHLLEGKEIYFTPFDYLKITEVKDSKGDIRYEVGAYSYNSY
ncbi:hypothetical protein KW805_00440 [Candidatus Pacearchaeota archaeon]|nr:hypothetical protein [Candidatus Pacearchaeota archaeon]